MALLYHMTLGELIAFDMDIAQIQQAIDATSEKTEENIDWTKAWGKKYPILIKYQNTVNIPYYAKCINRMLNELKQEYSFGEQDAMLVLKDILYTVWKARKNGRQFKSLAGNLKHSVLVWLWFFIQYLPFV